MGTVKQLLVELPADLADAVQEAVETGPFSSESEVIEAVLRAWHGDDGIVEPDIETLRAFVSKGIEDAEAGRFVDADEMFARLRTRYLEKIADRSGA